jgi:hypothetical protein
VFKDHIVEWVLAYIHAAHPEKVALEIIEDIDRRYDIPILFVSWLIKLHGLRLSAVPAFPGLRRFADGRDFKQWTGDDSKALMKVRTRPEYPI